MQRRFSFSDADERLRQPISLQRKYGKLLKSAGKLSISSSRGQQAGGVRSLDIDYLRPQQQARQLTVSDFQQLASEQDGRRQR